MRVSLPTRGVLASLLALCCVGSTLNACGAFGATSVNVTVLASWLTSVSEGTNFQAVIEDYASAHGFTVTYKGIRAVPTVLEVETASGKPPDIVVLPSPATLAQYIDDPISQLVLLDRDSSLTSDTGQWLSRSDDPDHVYGVTIKTDLKSLVWYDPTATSVTPHDTWQDLLALSSDLRAAGEMTPWCIGVEDSSGSGWAGTDWVEDILLHQSGTTAYQQWATGQLAWTSPEVSAAWSAWGDLLAASGMATTEAARIILESQWSDANDALVGASETLKTCALEHQASFVPANLESVDKETSVAYFPFPQLDATASTSLGVETSVDVAGLFSDQPEAEQLLRYLASREGQEAWARQSRGQFHSPRTDLDREAVYGSTSELNRQIADQLAQTGQTRCLDASDYMPPAVSRAFSRAVLEFLAEPTASRLPDILAQLDEVRASIPADQWLSSPCSA